MSLSAEVSKLYNHDLEIYFYPELIEIQKEIFLLSDRLLTVPLSLH